MKEAIIRSLLLLLTYVTIQHQLDDVAGWMATLVYWVQVLYCLCVHNFLNSTVLVPSTPELQSIQPHHHVGVVCRHDIAE
jgi:hypothetical protein